MIINEVYQEENRMPRIKKNYRDRVQDQVTSRIVALQHEYGLDNTRMSEILHCSVRTYVNRRCKGTFTLEELCRLSEFFHERFEIGDRRSL